MVCKGKFFYKKTIVLLRTFVNIKNNWTSIVFRTIILIKTTNSTAENTLK